jgi:hypothetical protein
MLGICFKIFLGIQITIYEIMIGNIALKELQYICLMLDTQFRVLSLHKTVPYIWFRLIVKNIHSLIIRKFIERSEF